MFLLRRKSDGRYFRNRGYHQDSSWRCLAAGTEDPRWVNDPAMCVPFASISGLKNSRGVVLGSPIPQLEDPSPEARNAFWKARGEWYSKKNAKTRQKWETEKFNEKYDIVEVKVEILRCIPVLPGGPGD